MKKSTKIRIIRLALLTAAVTLICRTPTTGETFPAAVAIISHLTLIHPGYIILSLPIAAGIIPHTARGIDPWGSLITMIISGVVSALLYKLNISIRTWQLAVLTSSINIIITSIFRLITATVYQLTLPQIAMETAIITAILYMARNIHNCLANTKHEPPITIAAFASANLLMLCGAGLDELLWPAAVFLSIWTSVMSSLSPAVQTIIASGITAAIAGQPQWGIVITMTISAYAVSLYKTNTMLLKCIVFIFTSLVLQTVESRVILGIDNYVLFTGAAAYIICSWRYEKRLKTIINKIAGEYRLKKDEGRQAAIETLKIKSKQIGELAELYGTYLDSRSALAYQFGIMEQIIDRAADMDKKTYKGMERIEVEVAASQCAASGSINGDCCGWDEIGNGRMAAVISDGMGKGKKAAAESLLVVKTILTMLKCGADTDKTLKMINTIMMIKDDSDSFATVDLAVVDKCTSKLRIYKIGAAPTLIRHSGKIEEIMLSAIPLGIVNGIRIQYVEKSLNPDDWIIMMSDGVSDGPEGRGALNEVKAAVKEIRSHDVQTMCDLIIDRSADLYIGKERDDLTVLALRIV